MTKKTKAATTEATLKTLPTKLSDLLDLAVTDALKVRRKGYRLDMATWHSPDDGTCVVCLAGAVIACELGVAPTARSTPGNFSLPIGRALHAIDMLRVGNIEAAARELKQTMNVVRPSARDRLTTRWLLAYVDTGYNGCLSWRQYRQMARELRKVGL